jgi:hypothetical protein
MISRNHAEARDEPVEGQNDDSILLSWQVHLLRRYPWKGVGAILGILATTALLWVILGPAGAVLLGIVLALSLAPFFLPQEFRLSHHHVRVRQGLRWRTRPWQAFRRAGRRNGRILLSTFPAEHPLDAWRCLVLIPAGNDDQVWAVVQDRLTAVPDVGSEDRDPQED